ncbi:MAG TPA: class I adenylate-forming enzyme family protein [Polyangiaceae bacterium]
MRTDAIGDALRARAARDAARPALCAPAEGAVLSFGQLASLSGRILELTGGDGGTIALYTESRLAQAALLTAGLMAGCVVCPINPIAKVDVLGRLVRHAKAVLLIADTTTPGLAAVGASTAQVSTLLQALPSRCTARPSAGSLARGGLLVYTSGSTGEPKGVRLSESQIAANVGFAVEHFGYDEEWVAGSVLPLFHTFTVISDLLPMMVCGGRVVVTSGFALAHLPASAHALAEHRVRSYSGVPIVFDMMLAMRVPLPESMRFAIAGAAPLAEATRTRYQGTYGHPILPCYGLTESTCFATVSAPDAIRPSAVGRAAGIEIVIVDDEGAVVTAGATGEIALRGASVIEGGYFDDGGANAGAFTEAGRFLSGDIGHLDADGFLFITGRKKNMLIRGGEKVYLEEVDRCLACHPAVADSCTVRVGARRHDDQAVAFIVPRCGAVDKTALVEHVTDALGTIARLDDVVVVTEIPRSATGKVLRDVLVASYAERR